MQVSGMMAGLYMITDWIMRLSLLNILWLVVNLPIICILFLMALSPSNTAIIVLAIPLVFLVPLLFVPATTAAFAIARDWLLKKTQISLLKSYLFHFKKNYKANMLSGFVLTGIWLIFLIDYFFFRSVHDLLAVMFTIIGLLLFGYSINFFCLSVHFHMSKKELLKNAYFVTIGSPLLLISILVINFSVIFISMTFTFLYPFFTVSLIAFLSFWAFHRFTLKVANKKANV